MGGGGCDLVALTAFYEQHYVCFCFSHTAGQWIHYDDDTRQLIWSKVAKGFLSYLLPEAPPTAKASVPLLSPRPNQCIAFVHLRTQAALR